MVRIILACSIALISLIAVAGHGTSEGEQSNRHLLTHDMKENARRLMARASDSSNGGPQLHCDVDSISGLGGDVTVSWSGVAFTRTYDWIGMWTSSRNLTLFSAPIKFKYLLSNPNGCPSHSDEKSCTADSACKWASGVCTASVPASNGSVTFHVQNMRSDVVFFYVSGDIQYPELIAASQNVVMESPELPQGAHLATGGQGVMKVYWRAGGKVVSPGVKFGKGYFKSPASGDFSGNVPDGIAFDFVEGLADPSRVYSEDDMCDRSVQPAGRQGWFDPPNLLEAELSGLKPGQMYWYIYGDNATGWSEARHFYAPPAVNRSRRTVIAAFGDMGQTEMDGSWHHSWDFNDKGELPSINTTMGLYNDDSIEMVLHIGDISYAVGFMSEWENFFWQIEPVASRMPWMTSIGNHEQVYSGSFYTGTDSGGECGVPYNAYFPFASQKSSASKPLRGEGAVVLVHLRECCVCANVDRA